jgi:hypothetical protein
MKDEVLEFTDLVVQRVIEYVEAKSEDLIGDENVHFILNEVRDELENGRWKTFLSEE